MPRMTRGQRKLWMHSLSGLDASQMPEAMMGTEESMAMKLRSAVMLLLTPMGIGKKVVNQFLLSGLQKLLEFGLRKEVSLGECERD